MIAGIGSSAAPQVAGKDAQLRNAAGQMEAVFLNELMKALRQTVPDDGLLNGGQGEAMFAAMMDDAIAQQAAAQQERGLGAALYRQLRTLLGTTSDPR